MNDILKKDTAALAPVVSPMQNALAAISTALANPNFTPETLNQMLEFNRELLKTQAKIDFDLSMAALQKELPTVHKSKKGHNGFYAPYEEVDNKTRPYYTKHGFSISYDTEAGPNNVTYYIGTLSHINGHSKTARIELPADKSGGKQPIQERASTLSYAKRYLLQMLLNIVTTDEDNDGDDAREAAPIDENLAEDITKRINKLSDAKEYIVKFLGYMKVAEVASIPRRDYAKAITALEAKEKASK